MYSKVHWFKMDMHVNLMWSMLYMRVRSMQAMLICNTCTHTHTPLLSKDSHRQGAPTNGSLITRATWLNFPPSPILIEALMIDTPHMRTMSPVFMVGRISSSSWCGLSVMVLVLLIEVMKRNSIHVIYCYWLSHTHTRARADITQTLTHEHSIP